MSTRTTALVLFVVMVAFMAISNTVGDGNALGGVAFFVWALCALGLIGLGVRAAAGRSGRQNA